MAKIKYFSSKGIGRDVEQPTSKGDIGVLLSGSHVRHELIMRKVISRETLACNTSVSAEPITAFH